PTTSTAMLLNRQILMDLLIILMTRKYSSTIMVDIKRMPQLATGRSKNRYSTCSTTSKW
ncbi:hypothetical protein SBRCBS47491_010232, partial [Sporothrix bragantina]